MNAATLSPRNAGRTSSLPTSTWPPASAPRNDPIQLTGCVAALRPLEHEVEVLAPGCPVIVRRLPATHDPVWPEVSDKPLEHVGVLATQVPMRAVERHDEDPADTSFVVVEGGVGVVRVAATENQDHLIRCGSDVAPDRPPEHHERVAEPLDRRRARHLLVGWLQEPRVPHRRLPRPNQDVQLLHGLAAHRSSLTLTLIGSAARRTPRRMRRNDAVIHMLLSRNENDDRDPARRPSLVRHIPLFVVCVRELP